MYGRYYSNYYDFSIIRCKLSASRSWRSGLRTLTGHHAESGRPLDPHPGLSGHRSTTSGLPMSKTVPKMYSSTNLKSRHCTKASSWILNGQWASGATEQSLKINTFSYNKNMDMTFKRLSSSTPSSIVIRLPSKMVSNKW